MYTQMKYFRQKSLNSLMSPPHDHRIGFINYTHAREYSARYTVNVPHGTPVATLTFRRPAWTYVAWTYVAYSHCALHSHLPIPT